MLFGDEPRFHKEIQIVDGQISGFKNIETDRHVGPGSYYASHNEEIRYGDFNLLFSIAIVHIFIRANFFFSGGWANKSFSRRQPMSPHNRPVERSYLYTAGVLLPTGFALPGSPVARQTPGPGYYGKSTMTPHPSTPVSSNRSMVQLFNI